MTELPSETRRKALDRFERSERRIWGFMIALTVLEMIFIWGFAELADFRNRVHVLIFWALLSTYGPMIAGFGMMWSHVSRNTQLVLKAIDLSTRKGAGETPRGPGPLGIEGE